MGHDIANGTGRGNQRVRTYGYDRAYGAYELEPGARDDARAAMLRTFQEMRSQTQRDRSAAAGWGQPNRQYRNGELGVGFGRGNRNEAMQPSCFSTAASLKNETSSKNVLKQRELLSEEYQATNESRMDLHTCCGYWPEELPVVLNIKNIKGTDLEYITEGMKINKKKIIENGKSFSFRSLWNYHPDPNNREFYRLGFAVQPSFEKITQQSIQEQGIDD